MQDISAYNWVAIQLSNCNLNVINVGFYSLKSVRYLLVYPHTCIIGHNGVQTDCNVANLTFVFNN